MKTRNKHSKSDLVGVDLFSGAGGMSLGAQWAGIRISAAVEADPHAATTFRTNHPETLVINRPIEEVDEIPVCLEKAERLVVFGGPPCQGFSTSNQRTRGKDNPQNWLFKHYLRTVGHLMPAWVVFENVTGLSGTENGVFLEAVVDGFKKLGYQVEQFVLSAHSFGVPQKRSRLFVVASLDGEKISVPQGKAAAVSVGEAIFDLPILRNGSVHDTLPYRCAPQSEYASFLRGEASSCGNHLVTKNAPYVIERFKTIPQGGNWSAIPPKLMSNYADASRCHTGIYKRLAAKEPAVVIGNFRKNMLVHPTQQRGLSVREAARLQSFPDSFAFKGSIGFQQQQVGNAVPPLLAKHVFESIM